MPARSAVGSTRSAALVGARPSFTSRPRAETPIRGIQYEDRLLLKPSTRAKGAGTSKESKKGLIITINFIIFTIIRIFIFIFKNFIITIF